LEGDAKTRHAELEKQITQIQSARREFTTGLLMTDQETRPEETRILVLGDHKRPGQPVVPGFLSILDPNPAVIPKPANPKTLGRRLALAQWIASPKNPLTARVFVNRLWQQHFGQGLVETANDFGLAGSRPSHPELLDWLAAEFVRSGWSVKRLHRTLVLSAAYRQAVGPADAGSAASAAAVGLRRSPRRLSAEQLRDALLATAGSLQLVSGGSPVWPDLPAEILQANPAFLDDNATRTKGWYPSPRERQSVRSVFWSRSAPCGCRSWRPSTCPKTPPPAPDGRARRLRPKRCRCCTHHWRWRSPKIWPNGCVRRLETTPRPRCDKSFTSLCSANRNPMNARRA